MRTVEDAASGKDQRSVFSSRRGGQEWTLLAPPPKYSGQLSATSDRRGAGCETRRQGGRPPVATVEKSKRRNIQKSKHPKVEKSESRHVEKSKHRHVGVAVPCGGTHAPNVFSRRRSLV